MHTVKSLSIVLPGFVNDDGKRCFLLLELN